MSVKVTLKSIETNKALGVGIQATKAALFVVSENIESDTRQYVPYDTGDLQKSARIRSVSDLENELIWGGTQDVDYAAKQYYGNYAHKTAQNARFAPRACGHWAEHAKADCLSRWREMFAAEVARRTHG